MRYRSSFPIGRHLRIAWARSGSTERSGGPGLASKRRAAILGHSGGGFPLWFWSGGGVPVGGGVAPGGGVPLGLVFDGGGGVASGAPPGCELGGAVVPPEPAAPFVSFGVVALDGALPLLAPLFELLPQAAADSDSATTHSNNRLRFIRSPLKGSRQTVPRRKPRSAAGRRRAPGISGTSAGYFFAAPRLFFLAGSLTRDLPKDPR